MVQNGIKFNQSDEPQITIESKADERGVLFSVTDYGINIEQEDVPKLFTLFQRLDYNGTYPRTGIGLTLGKKIVESHGGKIWVEYASGMGSVF